MMFVKDHMTKDIVSACNKCTLRRVIQIMDLHRMNAVPVVNQMGEYIGCISESDILSTAMPNYMKSILNTSFLANIDLVSKHLRQLLDHTVVDYIDKDYPFVQPDDTLSYAADLLFRTKRNVLPVVKGKDLVGLFRRIDFLTIAMVKEDDASQHNC